MNVNLAFEPGLKIDGETVCRTFQPSYVVTENGTLIVFCQGRLKGGRDNEPKVVLMNRSYDNGKSWEGAQIVSAPMNHFAISAYSASLDAGERISFLTCVGLTVTKEHYGHDATLLKDRTGIDLEVVGKDTPCVLCRYYSDDEGDTWNVETFTGDETPLYKDYGGFTPVFFNTIGQVHVIEEGPHAGRFIVAGPAYTVSDGEEMTSNFRDHWCSGSAIIYSDDRGETWSMDGMTNDYLGNEASAVSINQGEKILMIRRFIRPRCLEFADSELRPGPNERIANISEDGGKTWSDPFLLNMSGIRCHGTLARIDDRLYFSIPTGQELEEETDRSHGAIYFSDDEGQSWSRRIVEEGPYSYSTVGRLTDSKRITFFARGGLGDQGIGYRTFTDEWLENGDSQ